MNTETELQAVNTAISLVQVLEASIRLQGLAKAAIAAGQTHVTAEEMAASVAGDDAALDALRAAISNA